MPCRHRKLIPKASEAKNPFAVRSALPVATLRVTKSAAAKIRFYLADWRLRRVSRDLSPGNEDPSAPRRATQGGFVSLTVSSFEIAYLVICYFCSIIVFFCRLMGK